MKPLSIYLSVLLAFSFGRVFSQTTTTTQRNSVRKFISAHADFIQLESVSLVPGTFRMDGVAPSLYRLDEINASLVWTGRLQADSVLVTYRVFPFRLNARRAHMDYDSIRYNFLADKPTVMPGRNRADGSPIFDFKGLRSEGSIGRSLSLGNNQDAVLNSSLNLQLSGYFGDSLELTAVITDNNIPIQPEGNTKDLRDFDRIFLQIKKKSWQVSMGDLQLKESPSHFLQFGRRIQGVSFSTDNNISKQVKNSFFASGALAKGKFNRNYITPLEGNQGPYRLRGANNELYFVILAGTEKVFIDGVLLQRGEDRDYTINYNTAELTFTPAIQINKDARIQVEFEYADRNFLNTQLYVTNSVELQSGLTLRLSAYSSMDSKNAVVDQQLTSSQKQFLSAIGDSIQNAFFPNAFQDTFSTGKILYRKTDTLTLAGVHDSVFVFSGLPSDRLYSVSFTYIGEGKGNYRPLLNGNNGKVFEWVSPSPVGDKQGSYEPVQYLVTPKTQQVYAMNISYKPTSHHQIASEWSMSHFNRNLFSGLDKDNDYGFAGLVSYRYSSDSFRFLRYRNQLKTTMSVEQVSAAFKPLERIREVEFLRDWGLPFDAPQEKEAIYSAGMELSGQSSGSMKYEIRRYERGEAYKGLKQTLTQHGSYKGWTSSITASMLHYDDQNRNGRFLRPIVDVSRVFRKLKSIKVGAGFLSEYNQSFNKITDSLTPESFGFERIEFSVKSDQQLQNRWGLGYFTRINHFPAANKLTRSDISRNYSATAELLKSDKRQFRVNATYRELETITSPDTRKKDRNILGRAVYDFNELKGLLSGELFYEAGGGQEQKREISYIAVPVGQGNYTWVDYNNNGIEELNEFELAVYQDQKKYIRIFTPTNQFVKTQTVQFNYSLDISPGRLIQGNKKGLAQLLSRTSVNSSWQVNRKNLAGASYIYNPFYGKLLDTALVSYASFRSNSVFYNRTSSRWGMELNQNLSENKTLLNYGLESRSVSGYTCKIRFNLTRNFSANITCRSGVSRLRNEASSFENRNYDIRQESVEPGLLYLYKSKFRCALNYRYALKKNRIDFMEKTNARSMTMELKYNTNKNSVVGGRLSLNQFDFMAYPGAERTAAAFALLEGLSPGKNLLWNLDFTRRMSGNLEINFQYEGRQTGSNVVIHTGRASLRALF